jgi:lactate permease
MDKVMCTWRRTLAVWPALVVGGGSFALFQYTFATIHSWEITRGIELWPMTDIGGGLFSLVVTAIFLQFWQPKEEWHYDKEAREESAQEATSATPHAADDPHAAGAAAIVGNDPTPPAEDEPPLTTWSVTVAWAPWILMSVFLLLTGLVRQREGERAQRGPVMIGPIETNYLIPIPTLDKEVVRDPLLGDDKPERALFNFAWLTAPGTGVFFAALLSMAMFRMSRAQIKGVFQRTFFQMKIPIPTIACMLGLSYVTRYAGMDATLGVAFAATGLAYPFFAAILGWLGVFLTGTDAGSNALFGSLQKITATQLYNTGAFASLDLGQSQVLICTANSTGGVMGKMIDAQSICVATAATHQLGKEADIFKAVVWHSILLAAIVGIIVLLQAYLYPFTLLVPSP